MGSSACQRKPKPTPAPPPIPKVTVFRAGAKPAGLAFDGEHIWVANAGDNTVSSLRGEGTVGQLTLSGQVIRTVPVGQEPVALTYWENSLWVASRGEGTVSRLSADGEVVTAIRV